MGMTGMRRDRVIGRKRSGLAALSAACLIGVSLAAPAMASASDNTNGPNGYPPGVGTGTVVDDSYYDNGDGPGVGTGAIVDNGDAPGVGTGAIVDNNGFNPDAGTGTALWYDDGTGSAGAGNGTSSDSSAAGSASQAGAAGNGDAAAGGAGAGTVSDGGDASAGIATAAGTENGAGNISAEAIVNNGGDVISDGTRTYYWQYTPASLSLPVLVCNLGHAYDEGTQLIGVDAASNAALAATGGFDSIFETTNGTIWYDTDVRQDPDFYNSASVTAGGAPVYYKGSLIGCTEDNSAVVLLYDTENEKYIRITDGAAIDYSIPYDGSSVAYAGSRDGKYYFALADAYSVWIREFDAATGTSSDLFRTSYEEGVDMLGSTVSAKMQDGVIVVGVSDIEGSYLIYQWGELYAFNLADMSTKLLVSANDSCGFVDNDFVLLKDGQGVLQVYFRGGTADNSIAYDVAGDNNHPWATGTVRVVPADGSAAPAPFTVLPLVYDNEFCWFGNNLTFRPEGSMSLKQAVSGDALAAAGWTDFYSADDQGTVSEITSFDVLGSTLYFTITRFTRDPSQDLGWRYAYTTQSTFYKTEAGSDQLEAIYSY